MNSIKIQHISGLEAMSDAELRSTLQEIHANPIANVNWSEYPYAPEVSFKMAYSDKAIAILFEVKEDHVRAEAMENNGPVWQDSCVEFFVMGPDGEHYTNFEMNCAGTMLAARRTSRHDPAPFAPEQFTPIRRITSLPHEKIDSKGEGQSWWAMEVIPFEAFGYTEKPESLRANL